MLRDLAAFVAAILVGLLWACCASASERDECRWLAEKYQARQEVELSPKGPRCDLVTDKLAIEVDWANKWHEAVGQSLEYAAGLDKQPAIILLVRPGSKKDALHYARCRRVCDKHGILVIREEPRWK
jgi:hypothetical protein